jgi:predicted RNA-binding protein with PIN domain
MYSHVPNDLLVPALEAARASLRDMEDEEIPNKLRKVVAYSGGTLPPPLARSLGEFLDDDADLRSRALEEWPEADLMEVGASGASAFFLIRPDNWQFELGKLVARHETDSLNLEISTLQSRLAKVEQEASQGKQRLSDLRKELSETKQQVKQKAKKAAQRGKAKKSSQPEDPGAKVLAGRIAELEKAQVDADSAHDSLVDRAQLLEDKLREARAERAEAVKKFETRKSFGWGSADPVALARHLDDVASVVASGSRVAEYFNETMGFEQGPWKLPPGSRPDGINSIEWLMRQPRPFLLVVDGHNLAHKLRPAAAAEASTRDEIAHSLARFKLHTKTVARVVVVFDSSVSQFGDAYRGPSGIEIRFASASETADHEILALVDAADDPVVVVSSDREVREGAETNGAIGLWSEAMKEWMQSG